MVSRYASSNTRLARGVNGMWPPGTGSPSSVESSFTVSRVSSYVTSSFARAWAATPSPSLMSASSRCSVPTYMRPRLRASSCERLMTFRALSVNFSNMVGSYPLGEGGAPRALPR